MANIQQQGRGERAGRDDRRAERECHREGRDGRIGIDPPCARWARPRRSGRPASRRPRLNRAGVEALGTQSFAALQLYANRGRTRRAYRAGCFRHGRRHRLRTDRCVARHDAEGPHRADGRACQRLSCARFTTPTFHSWVFSFSGKPGQLEISAESVLYKIRHPERSECAAFAQDDGTCK